MKVDSTSSFRKTGT